MPLKAASNALGQLVSSELKKQLFALASSEWDRITPEKRQKATKTYIIRHRLGEKVSKFIGRGQARSFAVAVLPQPRLMSEWVCNHAMAIAGEKAVKPMKAVHQSLLEIMAFHGMPTERAQELYNAFDNFQL